MTPGQIEVNVTIAAINTEKNNIANAEMQIAFYQHKINSGIEVTDHDSGDIQFWTNNLINYRLRLEWLQTRLDALNAAAVGE